MNELLFKIAQSQKDEYQAIQPEIVVSRDIEAEVLESVRASTLIKVITGPRRAGKSTLVQRVLSQVAHAYFNFEDDRLPANLDTDDLLSVLEKVWGNDACGTLFFDEIQTLNRWEQFLHRLHRGGRNILVTGSNSHLLSKELATSLTGRYVSHTLLPFSWQETSRARRLIGKSHSKTETLLKQPFENYLIDGGFPDVVLGKSTASTYLPQLWNAVVSRDIVDRYKVRNVPALRALAELILQSIGARVSGRSLQKALPHKLSNTTIENYLAFAEEAFLFLLLQKFEPSLAKQKKADRKPYTFDTGFVRGVRPSLVSESQGQLLENYVFLELVRSGAEPNANLFYFQNPKYEEVDFVYLKAGLEPQLIQVCWTLKDPKTHAREVRSLADACQVFGVTHAEILTLDEEFVIHEGNLTITVRRAYERFTSTRSEQSMDANISGY